MKQLLWVSILLMALGTPRVRAQSYLLKGLEIYNPYYHNPAYIQAEKTVQLDFIGYNFNWGSGMWSSVMTTIPKYNSSAGIRFAQSSSDGSFEYWDLQLAYAYKHSFSENLHLNGGIQFSSGHVEYEDGVFRPDPDVLKTRHNGYLGLGVALEYHKLHSGLNSSFPLYLRREVLMEDNTTENQKDDADITNFHFLTGYSLGKLGRLTFDPIFGLDYRILYGGRTNQLQGYLGANMKIRNAVGFGFSSIIKFRTSGSSEYYQPFCFDVGYGGTYGWYGFDQTVYSKGLASFETI